MFWQRLHAEPHGDDPNMRIHAEASRGHSEFGGGAAVQSPTQDEEPAAGGAAMKDSLHELLTDCSAFRDQSGGSS
jgi:hypothetical protein